MPLRWRCRFDIAAASRSPIGARSALETKADAPFGDVSGGERRNEWVRRAVSPGRHAGGRNDRPRPHSAPGGEPGQPDVGGKTVIAVEGELVAGAGKGDARLPGKPGSDRPTVESVPLNRWPADRGLSCGSSAGRFRRTDRAKHFPPWRAPSVRRRCRPYTARLPELRRLRRHRASPSGR